MKNTLKRSLALLLVLLFAIPTFAFAEDLGVEAVSVEDIALVEDVATDDVVVEQAEEPVEDDNLDLAEENVVLGEEIAEDNEAEEIAEANGVKVKFDLDCTDASPATIADQDVSGQVSNPGDPARFGYIFDGWYNGSQKWDFDTDTTSVAMTLKAKWTPKKVIITYYKYNPNNNSTSLTVGADTYNCWDEISTKGEALYGDLLAKPASPEWDGYVLEGWYLNPNCTGASSRGQAHRWYFNGDKYPTGKTADNYKLLKANIYNNNERGYLAESENGTEMTLKLFAPFQSLYSVTFQDEKGNEVLVENAVVSGQEITVSAPAVTSKTFDHWSETSVTAGSKVDAAKEAFTVNSDKTKVTFGNLKLVADNANPAIVLTAVYASTTYKVTYNLNGVTITDWYDAAKGVADATNSATGKKIAEVAYGKKAIEPKANATISGMIVEGWYEDNKTTDPTKKFDFDAVVTADHNLYPNVQVGWTVSYFTKATKDGAYGVSASATETVVDGAKAKGVVGQNLDGAKFEGWYVKAESEAAPSDTQFDFNTAITKDISLYAKYNTTNITTYPLTIQYKPGDDDAYTEMVINVVSGETVQLPTAIANIQMSQHEIDYWYNIENSDERFVFGSTTVTAAKTIKAAYKTVDHTVRFQTNGGGSVAEKKVAHGNAVQAADVSAATKGTNYVAKPEWYTDANFTERFIVVGDTKTYGADGEPATYYTEDEATKVTEDITVYAKWLGKVQTVTLKAENAKGAKADSTTNVKVRYDTTVADALADKSLGNTVKLAQLTGIEAAAGYSFDGWYKGTETTEWSLSNDKVTGAMTLNAKFTGKVYTVKFETNGGTAVTSQAVAAGSKALITGKFLCPGVTNPSTVKVPAKEGYELVGWFEDEACTKAVATTTADGKYYLDKAIDKDLTFYAKWKVAEYTVTFKLDDILDADKSKFAAQPNIKHGTKAQDPGTPKHKNSATNNYAFLGWTTVEGGTEYYSFDTPVTKDITLYPHWDAAYTVEFIGSNGSSAAKGTTTQYVVADGKHFATEPTGDSLNETGKIFKGWYKPSATDPNKIGTDPFVFTEAITGNTTIFGKYESTNTVKVTFDLKSGKANNSTANIELFLPVNSKIEEKNRPTVTRDGYTFAGWKQSGQTADFDFNTAISENITLEAQWTVATYNVTYIVDGATYRTTTATHDEKLQAPTTPTKTGYTFFHWYTDEGLTEPFNLIGANKIKSDGTLDTEKYAESDATPVEKELKLYAKFTAQTFKLTFYKDASNAYTATTDFSDGTVEIVDSKATMTVAYGKTAEKLPTPKIATGTKSFVAWYTDTALTKEYSATTVVTGDVKLYAKFLNTVNVEISMTGWVYDGTAHQPTVTVKPVFSTDTAPAYTLSYKKKDEGDDTYTATAPTAAGSYTVKASVPAGTKTAPAEATANYTIDKADVTLTWPTSNKLTYNGAEQYPAPTVTGAKAGETPELIVTGKGKAPGNYTATVALPDSSNYRFARDTVTTFAYTIEASTTEPIVTAEINPDGTVTVTVTAADGSKISENKIEIGKDGATNDFTVTTKDNGDGTVTVTLTAKEGSGFKLSAPITVTGKIALPTATKITALKPGKKKMTVSWDVVTDADGYQIQYGLKKSAAKKMTPKKFTGATTAKATIKKLKKGKKYYFRIRTFKTVNGTTVYSDWSAWKKSAKVK